MTPPRAPRLDARSLRPGGERRRELGRDGISGMVTTDRALRAREVSTPGPEERRTSRDVLRQLLARVEGRRR